MKIFLSLSMLSLSKVKYNNVKFTIFTLLASLDRNIYWLPYAGIFSNTVVSGNGLFYCNLLMCPWFFEHGPFPWQSNTIEYML